MNKTFGDLLNFVRVGIWESNRDEMNCFQFFLVDLLKKIILAVRFFTAKRVISHAAALTYSTMLAIVPILAVVFAIARGFGFNKYIEDWFLNTFQSQPQAAGIIVGFVNSYLVHTKSGLFLGVGLVFMLYTVLMLVSNVERTFNDIWQVKKPRSIFRTFTDYLAMLLLFPIVIILTSGLTIFMATIAHRIPELELVAPLMRLIIDMTPFVFMSALFIGLYVFMPNTHVKLSNVVIPGVFAGVAMQLLQLVYVHSQIWVSSYNAIYGSFAALPMFMLWLQISWTICLFGAELCYTNQNLEFYDYNTKTSDISHRYRIMICALLMSLICKRFDKGGKPYNASELRRLTGIPIRIVNDMLYKLIEAKLLVEIISDEKGSLPGFMPSENIERLSFGVMVARLESCGKWKFSLPISNHFNDNWAKILECRMDYLNKSSSILLKDL